MPTLPSFTGVKTVISKLDEPIVHYTVRVSLIAHILATSYLPAEYINMFQHLAVRVILAVMVVAFLFWDIAAGALLAVLLVLTIQEAKSRQVGASVSVSGTEDIKKQEAKLMAAKAIESGLVPNSVYGQQQIPQITASNEQVGAYMNQIGELGISKQIAAGQGVQLVDGVPSVKVNMGQTGTQVTNTATGPAINTLATGPTLGLGKEGYQMNTAPTVNLGVEYDHPANKTLNENLKIQASGFITDKNLVDAQINSITGLDGAQPPCFVASESGIWNAQGFGSIARAVDNEDCPHSFV